MESAWLRDAISSSLISTSTVNDGSVPQVPVLGKLVEGLLYSRRLILTYHLVVLGIIAIYSAINWSGRTIRWRARRSSRIQLLASDDAYEDSDGSTYSQCSTLKGTVSPPTKYRDEITPLLECHRSRPTAITRKTWWAINSTIRSFHIFRSYLMYQPKPLPLFNKTLPSNGTSVAVLALIGLNIFYAFFHISFNVSELFVVADRCGLIFAANLPLLYLLAAKNQPLKILTGSSYESLNIFHRRLGELLCVEAVLHFLGMLGVWYTLFRPNHFSFQKFLLEKVIIIGIGAFVSYELLYFTSLASFRQRWYELFLGMHIVLQTAALVLLFFHHPQSRIYVGIALAIFLIDRLVYRFVFKSVAVEAYVTILEDKQTVKLSARITRRPPSLFSQVIGRSVKDGWQATDHVFVSIPSLGRTHMLQSHPFTIASAAPSPGFDETQLDLLIRAQNGFSRDLLLKARRLEYPNHQNRLSIRLDGPYGSPHARNLLVDSNLAIVVAGGSGIAVGWPLIHHLLAISRSTDTEVDPTSVLQRRKIVLIWVVHKHTHVEWIGDEEITEVRNMGVEIVIPKATEEIGRPDLRNIISGVINVWRRDRREDKKKIRVVASGPDSMGRLVRNTCADMLLAGQDIDVIIEKFGW